MAKILEIKGAKPIRCACCGCLYEFEKGDDIELETFNKLNSKPVIVRRQLKCPMCNTLNDIEFENMEGDNE